MSPRILQMLSKAKLDEPRQKTTRPRQASGPQSPR
jgi:hypothetical protein